VRAPSSSHSVKVADCDGMLDCCDARAMSALGQKRTFTRLQPMSALPPKADLDQHGRDVRFVPKADICGAAICSVFDQLALPTAHYDDYSVVFVGP